MREKISVLIADDNVELTGMLKEYIDSQEDMHTAEVASDGLEAVELIDLLTPDVVILDMIMPNLDGIGVLERIANRREKPKPLFLVLSGIGLDTFIQKTIALGAEYYIIKPFDVDVLISRIRQVYNEKSSALFSWPVLTKPQLPEKPRQVNNSLEIETTNLLRSIGIPPHLSGYHYIREAVIQAIRNPRCSISITRVLYPSIAEKFGTSSQKVERSIRNAIDNAWGRGTLQTILPPGTGEKPANLEFIAILADRIRILTDAR